jgi:hypothetical protein
MSAAGWKFVIDGSPVTVAVQSWLVVNTAEAAIDAADTMTPPSNSHICCAQCVRAASPVCGSKMVQIGC